MQAFRRLIGFVSLFVLPQGASSKAVSLKPAAIAAWDEYARSAILDNEQRAASEGGFLWTDEVPGRSARVRAGEIVVAPAVPHSSRRVPDGLIHDWVGAAFIANVNLDHVFGTLRDYSRYKDWFQPTVADARLITSSETTDHFSMVLVNRCFLNAVAIDMEYESRFVRLHDRRGYSISRSTRVQEIDNYRSTGEHRLPEGVGSGMVWKVMSITRYMERNGGVYLELEAIGLSRDIPASLRWVIEPIVRHELRAALTTSLQQTAYAVSSNHGTRVPALSHSIWRGTSNKTGDRIAPHK